MSTYSTILALSFCLTSYTAVYAQKKAPCSDTPRTKESCDTRIKVITPKSSLPISATDARSFVVRYINPFRYSYSLRSSTVSISAPTPPALLAALPSTNAATLPPLKGPAKAQMNAGGDKPPETDAEKVTDAWWDLRGRAFDLSGAVTKQRVSLNALVVDASSEQQCYIDRLREYSASLLRGEEIQNLREFAKNNSATPWNPVKSGGPWTTDCRSENAYQWPSQDIDNLDVSLLAMQAEQTQLAKMAGYSAWITVASDKDLNDKLTSFLADNVKLVEGWQGAATAYSTFVASISYINFWRGILATINQQDTDQPLLFCVQYRLLEQLVWPRPDRHNKSPHHGYIYITLSDACGPANREQHMLPARHRKHRYGGQFRSRSSLLVPAR